jgi:hypothetical protein
MHSSRSDNFTPCAPSCTLRWYVPIPSMGKEEAFVDPNRVINVPGNSQMTLSVPTEPCPQSRPTSAVCEYSCLTGGNVSSTEASRCDATHRFDFAGNVSAALRQINTPAAFQPHRHISALTAPINKLIATQIRTNGRALLDTHACRSLSRALRHRRFAGGEGACHYTE